MGGSAIPGPTPARGKVCTTRLAANVGYVCCVEGDVGVVTFVDGVVVEKKKRRREERRRRRGGEDGGELIIFLIIIINF